MFEGPDTVLKWNDNADVDLDEYEVREGANFDTGVNPRRSRTNQLKVGALSAPATYAIKAIDTSGNASSNAAVHTVTPAAPGTVTITAAFDGGDLKLTWPEPPLTSYPVAR